jgi:hypothetical protein
MTILCIFHEYPFKAQGAHHYMIHGVNGLENLLPATVVINIMHVNHALLLLVELHLASVVGRLSTRVDKNQLPRKIAWFLMLLMM